jgi:hypothetical protein
MASCIVAAFVHTGSCEEIIFSFSETRSFCGCHEPCPSLAYIKSLTFFKEYFLGTFQPCLCLGFAGPQYSDVALVSDRYCFMAHL